jgi:hypothetical protein
MVCPAAWRRSLTRIGRRWFVDVAVSWGIVVVEDGWEVGRAHRPQSTKLDEMVPLWKGMARDSVGPSPMGHRFDVFLSAGVRQLLVVPRLWASL